MNDTAAHPYGPEWVSCSNCGRDYEGVPTLCDECSMRAASFERQREAKAARLRARATKRREAAGAAFASAERIGSVIPLGQPILVGHHSERRHRRDLARIDSSMRRGVEATAEAQRLERRAERLEEATTVSSDDPAAISKLRQRVAELEASRARAKQVNALIRKHSRGGTDAMVAALVAAGVAPGIAAQLVQPDFAGRVGVPAYLLANHGAEIRRLEARIQELAARAAAAPVDERHGAVRLAVADNRVQLHFPDKPSAEARAALKANGFRWAPSVGAWQRQQSDQALSVARRILESLSG